MAQIIVDAGICGMCTTITARSEDGMTVDLEVESECPHVMAGSRELKQVDAYSEIGRKPHETEVYGKLSPHLPHVACPVYSGFFKAVELAAGLALPRDVTMKAER